MYLFLAGYYLVYHFRDRAERHLSFSVIWFCMAAYAFGAAGLYSAENSAAGRHWQQIQLLGAVFVYPTMALFVAHLAGHRPSRLISTTLYTVSVLFAAGLLFTPWFFTHEPAHKEFFLAGIRFRYPEVAPGWLGMLCYLWGMVVTVASVGLAFVAWRQGRRGGGLILCGLLVIVICSANDSLVGTNVYRAPYLVEHGFAVFAFGAAHIMQDRFLRARDDLNRRTIELTRANEELRSLDTMKMNLLANVSHELRTPLVSIRGYTELMLRGELGPVTDEQVEGLRLALGNAERLHKLIDNLLDQATLNDGTLTLQKMRVDLRDVVTGSVAAALPRARKKGVVLRQILPDDEPVRVLGDPGMLGQVLDNLIENAVKFSPVGGEVRVRAESLPPALVRVVVTDQGVGIPEAELEQIFARFYRGDSAGIERVEGTGLGLAIVEEIVRLHSGEVGVTSEEHRGSCFEVRLPAHPPVDALEEHSRPLVGHKILLVDDDREVVEFLALALRREGYQVQAVSDGPAALDWIRAERFGLVLLDLTLHGMDGIEVLETLRADPAGRDLRVIVLTALSSERVRKRCFAAGCSDFLVKPVAIDTLRTAMRGVLSGSAKRE